MHRRSPRGCDRRAAPRDLATALFGESIGRLVVEVARSDVATFLAVAGPATVLGTVSAEPILSLPRLPAVPVATLATSFHGADA